MGAAPGAWFHFAMAHAAVVSLPSHLSTPDAAVSAVSGTMPVAVDAQVAVTRTAPARGGVAHLQLDLARRLAVRADFLDHFTVEDVQDTVLVHVEGAGVAVDSY